MFALVAVAWVSPTPRCAVRPPPGPGGPAPGTAHRGGSGGGDGGGEEKSDQRNATGRCEKGQIDRTRKELADWPALAEAGRNTRVDPAYLAAVGIRESNFENIRERGGGAGIGVFQLTNRPGVSEAQAFDIGFSANYAGRMLRENFDFFSDQRRFPDFNQRDAARAAIAAYNFGPSEISGNPATIDRGTPGNNYSTTVILVATKCF